MSLASKSNFEKSFCNQNHTTVFFSKYITQLNERCPLLPASSDHQTALPTRLSAAEGGILGCANRKSHTVLQTKMQNMVGVSSFTKKCPTAWGKSFEVPTTRYPVVQTGFYNKNCFLPLQSKSSNAVCIH